MSLTACAHCRNFWRRLVSQPFRERSRLISKSTSARLGSITIGIFAIVIVFAVVASAADGSRPNAKRTVEAFVENTCVHCHNDDASEGGLNLDQLPLKLESEKTRGRWIQIYDRIEKREMPPDAEDLPEPARKALLSVLSKAIHDADYADVIKEGRGRMRRLNRGEYEANLRDILELPHLDVRDMLPEDREGDHFNKSAKSLDISRVQLAAYLDAADGALRQAVASGVDTSRGGSSSPAGDAHVRASSHLWRSRSDVLLQELASGTVNKCRSCATSQRWQS